MPEPGVVRPTDQFSARDRQILDAAGHAFHERGFHGVGMDELGQRAGLSGPSLYRHFSGKDEILATLLNGAMDELTAATRPAPGEARPELEQAVDHHVRFALEQAHLITLYQREVRNLVEPWASMFARRMGDYTRAWEELLAARRPDDSPETVAATTQACLGLVFSVSGWPGRARRVGDPDDVVALVWRLVERGVAS
ncbi:AcrR family transcriptional regulator [Nocardioides sp. BE266]|uniref:TetR/AcrR family transcriptional regulator n=1 Tax=Nocardioides sp. BE266 TaxID=2817725 RepID=UPI002860597D|nr:TetR/AcrR family transcriptional regulator [Nocardioides sp. BE266]MDR7254240.1 AcrR family transcriptional regulator [Nocardioides sp. BE266]